MLLNSHHFQGLFPRHHIVLHRHGSAKIRTETGEERIVVRNGGSLNGEQGRTVLNREGVPMAATR